MDKLNKDDLKTITGGSTSGELYKYKATITVNGQTVIFEKDGFHSQEEAKSAANEAISIYLAEHSITCPVVPIIVVTKYLSGESDPFVIKPTIAY